MRKQQNVCANNNFMSSKCTRNMRMHLNLVSQIHKKYAHSGWRTARQNRMMDPKLHQFKIGTDNVLPGDLLQSKEPRTSKDFRRAKSENKISIKFFNLGKQIPNRFLEFETPAQQARKVTNRLPTLAATRTKLQSGSFHERKLQHLSGDKIQSQNFETQ